MSLITFRSPTQGSVIMFGDNAQQLLSALSLKKAGEITTAELPAMIEQLKAAMAADKAHNPIVWPEENNPDIDKEAPVLIHFSQRAAPMLQLMERCLAATETIRWPA
jgi:hypothetical protein